MIRKFHAPPKSEAFPENKILHKLYEGLKNVFAGRQKSDKVLEHIFYSHKWWTPSQRAFARNVFYYYIQHWRLLWHLIETEPNFQTSDMHRAYGAMCILEGQPLPKDKVFFKLDAQKILDEYRRIKSNPAIFHSWPDWLAEEILKNIPAKEQFETLAALGSRPPVFIRTNTLKGGPRALQEALAKEGIVAKLVENNPQALEIESGEKLFRSEPFQTGLFEVQDINSQAVATFCNPKPGSRVADVCAGAGGKTLHLAALMQNKGRIWVSEIKKYKMDELRRRSARAGISIVEPHLSPDGKDIKRQHGKFDIVLVDAPCSGTGVVRRNPDIKWHIRPEGLAETIGTQQEILTKYSPLCKVGGELIFAVCSLFPQEGSEAIRQFISSNPNWSITEEKHLPVKRNGGDGFYMVKLKRGGGA